MPRRRASTRLPNGSRLPRWRDLLPAERELVAACRDGRPAIVGIGWRPTEKTPGNHVRAPVLRAICLGKDKSAPVHEQGVQLMGAWIDGDLDLRGATLLVPISIFLSWLAGKVDLRDAETQTLAFNGSRCAGITADRLRCHGSIFLRSDFQSNGEVRLRGATIGGSVECDGSSLENGTGRALSVDRATIEGSVFLRAGFKSRGEVCLHSTTIGGVLDCSGGTFENSTGAGLSADSASIDGSVFLREGFKARGAVRLIGVTIRGNLECDGSSFSSDSGDALTAEGATIYRNVFMRGGFTAGGMVRFTGAMIRSDLVCVGGRFTGGPDGALDLSRAEVAGTAFFDGSFSAEGAIDFRSASINTLADLPSIGPPLFLDGLHLKRFGPNAACDAASRIAWLDRQHPQELGADFKPQPWEQCATVLASMGHEDDARRIRLEKRRRLRRARLLRATTLLDKLRAHISGIFDRLLDLSIGYGWRPMRPVYALLVVWLVASFGYAALPPGIMAPTDPRLFLDPSIPAECRVDWIGLTGPVPPRPDDESRRRTLTGTPAEEPPPAWKDICGRRLPSEYSAFQPVLYALDVLLPVVDLRQERDWAPRVTDVDGKSLRPIGHDPEGWGWGYVVRAFEWFLIAFGWVASLLLAAAVSGVVRRD